MSVEILFSGLELNVMLNSYGGQGINISASGIGLYGLCGDAHEMILNNHKIDPRKLEQAEMFNMAQRALEQMEQLGMVVRDEKYPAYFHKTYPLRTKSKGG